MKRAVGGVQQRYILLMALWGPLSGTSYGIAGLLMLAVSYRLYRAEDRAERLALLACLLVPLFRHLTLPPVMQRRW
ncbi:TraX family protein (plasmid) [Escherichia coli]